MSGRKRIEEIVIEKSETIKSVVTSIDDEASSQKVTKGGKRRPRSAGRDVVSEGSQTQLSRFQSAARRIRSQPGDDGPRSSPSSRLQLSSGGSRPGGLGPQPSATLIIGVMQPQPDGLHPGTSRLQPGAGGLQPSRLQPGAGGPYPGGLQSGAGGPYPGGLQSGAGGPYPGGLQSGPGGPYPGGLQSGPGGLQPARPQPGAGGPYPARLQPGASGPYPGGLQTARFQPGAGGFEPSSTRLQQHGAGGLQPSSSRLQQQGAGGFQPSCTRLQQPDAGGLQPCSSRLQQPGAGGLQPCSSRLQQPGAGRFQPSSTRLQQHGAGGLQPCSSRLQQPAGAGGLQPISSRLQQPGAGGFQPSTRLQQHGAGGLQPCSSKLQQPSPGGLQYGRFQLGADGPQSSGPYTAGNSINKGADQIYCATEECSKAFNVPISQTTPSRPAAQESRQPQMAKYQDRPEVEDLENEMEDRYALRKQISKDKQVQTRERNNPGGMEPSSHIEFCMRFQNTKVPQGPHSSSRYVRSWDNEAMCAKDPRASACDELRQCPLR